MSLRALGKHNEAESVAYVYIGVLQRAWLDILNVKVQSCFTKERYCPHAPVDKQWLELHKSWFVTCHVTELVGFVRTTFLGTCNDVAINAKWNGRTHQKQN
jgi:hypothetical protein